MASKKIRTLKPGDGISHEEAMERRRHYTDEDARKLGYPNVHVLHLEDRLGQIAGQWRRTKDDQLVSKYRETLYEMILNGYNVYPAASGPAPQRTDAGPTAARRPRSHPAGLRKIRLC
ncbi:MAG: hypothetical protein L0154_28040 [Chloroflexi bacterium]|nr:hypothetical protein [Chloroflexota bacterium]